MDQKVRTELETLRQELHELIGKLDAQAEEIRREFHGIGSEYCAAELNDVAKEYRKLEKRLAAAITAAVQQVI